MGKVSIGLRGWRFEEADIFDEAGEFKPLEEIPDDPRERLVRLLALIDEPCDACYLVHGEANVSKCRPAEIVYGEPGSEVLLCGVHEADFIFWFREDGGSKLQGTSSFQDAFHEWFADGNRAPDGYDGLDHVETDPEDLPEPPSPKEVQDRLNDHREQHRIDIRQLAEDAPVSELSAGKTESSADNGTSTSGDGGSSVDEAASNDDEAAFNDDDAASNDDDATSSADDADFSDESPIESERE